MPVEMLTYADLAERLTVSPEAARALARRLQLPRQRGNDGKARVSIDISEVQHKPLSARSPAGHQADFAMLTAKIVELEDEIRPIGAGCGQSPSGLRARARPGRPARDGNVESDPRPHDSQRSRCAARRRACGAGVAALVATDCRVVVASKIPVALRAVRPTVFQRRTTMQMLIVLCIIPLGIALGCAMMVTGLLKVTRELTTTKEIVARLEGELAVLAALRSQPSRRQIAG